MQENLKVKFKKLHPNTVIPQYAKPGDAGVDLTAVSIEFNEKLGCITYDTGLSIEIPEGYVGLIFPRSSIYKTIHSLSNSVGVIDSGFAYSDNEGDIQLKITMDTKSDKSLTVNKGDRIMQGVLIPYGVTYDDDVSTIRNGGLGHSGM